MWRHRDREKGKGDSLTLLSVFIESLFNVILTESLCVVDCDDVGAFDLLSS